MMYLKRILVWAKLYLMYYDYAKIIYEMLDSYTNMKGYKLEISKPVGGVSVVALNFWCSSLIHITVLFVGGVITVTMTNCASSATKTAEFYIYTDDDDDSSYTDCVTNIYIDFVYPFIDNYTSLDALNKE